MEKLLSLSANVSHLFQITYEYVRKLFFVENFFNISWKKYLGSINIYKGAISICTKLVESLVKALVRSLYSVSDEIYLNDLANVVVSQAGYIMGINLIHQVTLKWRAEQIFRTEDFLQYQAEIHHWLIYLAENNKLPGKYEIYLGKFSRT